MIASECQHSKVAIHLTNQGSAGSLEIVSLLINKGADVNHVNGKGQASLHYAASKNHPEVC